MVEEGGLSRAGTENPLRESYNPRVTALWRIIFALLLSFCSHFASALTVITRPTSYIYEWASFVGVVSVSTATFSTKESRFFGPDKIQNIAVETQEIWRGPLVRSFEFESRVRKQVRPGDRLLVFLQDWREMDSKVGTTLLQDDMVFTWIRDWGESPYTIPHLSMGRWLRIQRRLVLMPEKERTLEALRREARAALEGLNLEKAFGISGSLQPWPRAFLIDSLAFFGPPGAKEIIERYIRKETDLAVKDHLRATLQRLLDRENVPAR